MPPSHQHDLLRTEQLAAAVAESGYYIGRSVLAASLTEALAQRVRELARRGALAGARIGRAEAAQAIDQIRNDETLWLSDQPEAIADPAEAAAVAAVDGLRRSLNEQLFLGAGSSELHVARYAAGARYRTHRDRFRDDDARLLSLVFYLNPDWPPDAGGELVLYAPDDSGAVVARVAPAAGTMVCFRSERFPHEVLPATRERFSLTGWLRRRGSPALI